MMQRTATLSTWLAGFLLAGVVLGNDAPTLVTITPDGQMGDWAAVLTNPRNVTLDGDGFSVNCAQTPDRDCPVDSEEMDLRRFAWTYDDAALYVFAERFTGSGGRDAFFLHVDMDRDGLMEHVEDRIVRFFYEGNSGHVDVDVYEYDARNPPADPFADPQGYADGYQVPGRLGTNVYHVSTGITGTLDGERFEAAIPWETLGLAGPAAIGFHLGVHGHSVEPHKTEDNLGGPNGRPGTTAFFSHSVKPPRTGAYGPNEAIRYTHVLTNLGNLPDAYRFQTTSSEGFELWLYSDPNGDGDLADGRLLGIDADGDGDYTGPSDLLACDSDGDFWPDTNGPVSPGGDFPLVLEIFPRPGANGVLDSSRILVTSSGDSITAEVEDLSAIGWITLIPDRRVSSEPGIPLALAHELRNNLGMPTYVDFEWISTQGWTYDLWTDPDGDGNPSDGSPLLDRSGDGLPDLRPSSGESLSFVARTTVPVGTPLGTQEFFLLRGVSEISETFQASLLDEIMAADVLGISPAYLIMDGSAKNSSAGRSIFFRHLLTYSGASPDSFLIIAPGPPGHTATIYTDPNGDGVPTDGQAIASGSSTGPLEPLGGTFPFVIRLDVDPGAPPGTGISFTVGAASETNPALSYQVADEAIVSLIAAFADSFFTQQESLYSTCGDIHALVTGLLPNQAGRYRIRWINEEGPATVRITPFDSDAAGEGTDALSVTSTAAAGPYSLRLEEWDGMQWHEISQDEFLVDGFGSFTSLTTGQTVYLLEDEMLGISAILENIGNTRLTDVVLHFAVIDPTGTLVLQGDGSFVPAWPGVWTRTMPPFALNPGEDRTEAFTIGPVGFPSPGTYSVQVIAEDPCGDRFAVSTTNFEVTADSDGDGWTDLEESVFGTDPLDRDTDDDGILDFPDGAWDADGDTVIDALECDADNDGLPDGLEVGLDGSSLDPDTDTGAGCFRPDADAGSTVTNRLDPDTDGGGELDGAEDLDQDGVWVEGEKHPLDPTDDRCAWTPPPEVSHLFLARQGGDLLLVWDDLSGNDACLLYRVLSAIDAPPVGFGSFLELAVNRPRADFVHLGAAADGTLRFYLVTATGHIGGEGPIGHYGL